MTSHTLLIDALVLLGLLQVKHFVFDFTALQTPWMYKNKGNPRHLGGYVHSLLHVFGTLIVLNIASYLTSSFPHMTKPISNFDYIKPVLQCMAVEFIWHWLTDLVKTDVVKVKKWGPTTHSQFWVATGLDQFSHQFCYLVLVAILVKPLL